MTTDIILFPAISETILLILILPVLFACISPEIFSKMVLVPVPTILDITLGFNSPFTVKVKLFDTALTGSENVTLTISCDVIPAAVSYTHLTLPTKRIV